MHLYSPITGRRRWRNPLDKFSPGYWSLPLSKFSGRPLTFFHVNLLFSRSHQAEIIIILYQIKKAFYSRTQQRDQVRVESKIMRSWSS